MRDFLSRLVHESFRTNCGWFQLFLLVKKALALRNRKACFLQLRWKPVLFHRYIGNDTSGVTSNVTQEITATYEVVKALKSNVSLLATLFPVLPDGFLSNVIQERGFFVQRNSRMWDLSGTCI
jgi:hypothetical protein